MKATLHTRNETTQMFIDLPEARLLAGARVNIYSNIDHVLWEATASGVTVQHISTTPTPGASLRSLATSLRSATTH